VGAVTADVAVVTADPVAQDNVPAAQEAASAGMCHNSQKSNCKQPQRTDMYGHKPYVFVPSFGQRMYEQ
jgi:hypothetical protein